MGGAHFMWSSTRQPFLHKTTLQGLATSEVPSSIANHITHLFSFLSPKQKKRAIQNVILCGIRSPQVPIGFLQQWISMHCRFPNPYKEKNKDKMKSIFFSTSSPMLLSVTKPRKGIYLPLSHPHTRLRFNHQGMCHTLYI